MYLNTTVKIPVIKGKIITKKKGNVTYILYQYDSEYNQEKQYAVPKRAIVGKVSGDDSTMMVPNEKFQIYFPDAEIPEELPFAYRSCCLKIGSCIIIQKVIDEYTLRPMLAKRFGDDTGLILDLVAYLVVEEENAGQYYPDYAFTHPLFSEKMKIYSDSKVCSSSSRSRKTSASAFWMTGIKAGIIRAGSIFPMIPPTRTVMQAT